MSFINNFIKKIKFILVNIFIRFLMYIYICFLKFIICLNLVNLKYYMNKILKMLVFSVLYFLIVIVYAWVLIPTVGYSGVFWILNTVIVGLGASVAISFYEDWMYCVDREYGIMFWTETGNNILISFNFKVDIFSYVLSLIIFFALFFVLNFVYPDLVNDKDGSNFILTLSLFGFFMLLLSISGNLLVFYLGWEGIGITSLILVSYWNERARSIKASFKIFTINKIGDFFIFIILCIIASTCGDLDFDAINAMLPLLLNQYFYSLNINIIEILGILLLLGSSIKSAQFGFHIWLLEAMEAPLGASALMHSSTLVVSGFVLLYRLSSIVETSSYIQPLMFLMGSFSATFGSLIACFQYELKTIMAYSTISNMGYLFVLFSLNAYYEAIFFMAAHAFVKIFMFLTVGSIIMYCNGCQDIRWMGGLLLYIPGLWASYMYGGFCLIGLPYLSGYYCKQYILTALSNSFVIFKGVENILILSFFTTGVYIVRSSYLIFLGPKNGHRKLYSDKMSSLHTLLDLLLLSLVAFSAHFVLAFILLQADQVLYNNIFVKSNLSINDLIDDIELKYYLQWFMVYWLKFLIFSYWCIWTYNTKWDTLFCYFLVICFIFLKFIIHVIIL